MKTEIQKTYIAADGKKFHSAGACREYERSGIRKHFVGLKPADVDAIFERSTDKGRMLCDLLITAGSQLSRLRHDTEGARRKTKASANDDTGVSAEAAE